MNVSFEYNEYAELDRERERVEGGRQEREIENGELEEDKKLKRKCIWNNKIPREELFIQTSLQTGTFSFVTFSKSRIGSDFNQKREFRIFRAGRYLPRRENCMFCMPTYFRIQWSSNCAGAGGPPGNVLCMRNVLLILYGNVLSMYEKFNIFVDYNNIILPC